MPARLAPCLKALDASPPGPRPAANPLKPMWGWGLPPCAPLFPIHTQFPTEAPILWWHFWQGHESSNIIYYNKLRAL